MGAETFYHTATDRNAEEAFYKAIGEAQYDYGHAGYTGTIAEKDRFIVIHTGQEVTSREQAVCIANRLIRDRDSTKQIRVKISELRSIITNLIDGNIKFEKIK